MDRAEMLSHVCEDSSDYHDGLDGWFGFDVRDGETLTACFFPADGKTGGAGKPIEYRWRLTPIEDDA